MLVKAMARAIKAMIDFLALLEIPTSRRMVVSPVSFVFPQGENAGRQPKSKLLKVMRLC
jgi:hypothetical protein